MIAQSAAAPAASGMPATPATPAARAVLVLAGTAAALTGAERPPVVPDTLNACAGSIRFGRDGTRWFAVWWTRSERGRALLTVSQSSDSGRTWSPSRIADGRDAATLGCDRPAPAVAVDAAGGYAHFAYWMAPTDGAGVFFTHYMDSDGLFHAPVAAVYGEQPVNVDVAADGETVAVVFEDPNARGGLGLALSRTAGHIFEHRERVRPAHSGAAAPAAAVAGNRVAIAWRDIAAGNAAWRVQVGRVATAPR